jgi:iduronate 2-sulfatase
LKSPANLEGRSLRALLENLNAKWDKAAVTQVLRGEGGPRIMGYSVRTERWRYTEWDGGKAGAELYDHDTDPHEWHNLAKEEKFVKTIADLKKLLPSAKPKPDSAGKREGGK